MTRLDFSFPILIGCFVLLCLAAGLLVLEYPPLVMRLPILAGLFTAAMCITIVIRASKTSAGSSLTIPPGEPIDKTRLMRLAGLTSILPVANFLGYGWGLAVFLGLYLAFVGLSWRRCLVAALLCALLIEIVFVQLLRVSLPTFMDV